VRLLVVGRDSILDFAGFFAHFSERTLKGLWDAMAAGSKERNDQW
jgi:hypothetical protein